MRTIEIPPRRDPRRDPPMKRRELLRQLEGCGARFVREGGSHAIYAAPSGASLVVPRHTEISSGVTRKLLREGCGARRDPPQPSFHQLNALAHEASRGDEAARAVLWDALHEAYPRSFPDAVDKTRELATRSIAREINVAHVLFFQPAGLHTGALQDLFPIAAISQGGDFESNLRHAMRGRLIVPMLIARPSSRDARRSARDQGDFVTVRGRGGKPVRAQVLETGSGLVVAAGEDGRIYRFRSGEAGAAVATRPKPPPRPRATAPRASKRPRPPPAPVRPRKPRLKPAAAARAPIPTKAISARPAEIEAYARKLAPAFRRVFEETYQANLARGRGQRVAYTEALRNVDAELAAAEAEVKARKRTEELRASRRGRAQRRGPSQRRTGVTLSASPGPGRPTAQQARAIDAYAATLSGAPLREFATQYRANRRQSDAMSAFKQARGTHEASTRLSRQAPPPPPPPATAALPKGIRLGPAERTMLARLQKAYARARLPIEAWYDPGAQAPRQTLHQLELKGLAESGIIGGGRKWRLFMPVPLPDAPQLMTKKVRAGLWGGMNPTAIGQIDRFAMSLSPPARRVFDRIFKANAGVRSDAFTAYRKARRGVQEAEIQAYLTALPPPILKEMQARASREHAAFRRQAGLSDKTWRYNAGPTEQEEWHYASYQRARAGLEQRHPREAAQWLARIPPIDRIPSPSSEKKTS